jgi:hypothetical protein
MAPSKGRFVDVEFVGIHGALDDVLAEAIGRGDQDDVPEARLRVERKDHAARREVRTDHLHDSDGEQDLEVIEPLVDAVVDGAVREETGEAAAAGVEQGRPPPTLR